MNDDPLKAVREYFKITEDAKAFILKCNKCRVGYELTKQLDGTVRGGNILALFNHAHSHFPKTKARYR
jgi:hypothetical protein